MTFYNDELRERYNQGYDLGFKEGKEGVEYKEDISTTESEKHYYQGYVAGYADGRNVRTEPIPPTTVEDANVPAQDTTHNMTASDAEKPHLTNLTEVTDDGSVVTNYDPDLPLTS